MTNSKYDKNNIFAKIIRKEAKAEVVYEDEHVLCIKDIFPKAPIHVLIVPKAEFTDIFDFSPSGFRAPAHFLIIYDTYFCYLRVS